MNLLLFFRKRASETERNGWIPTNIHVFKECNGVGHISGGWEFGVVALGKLIILTAWREIRSKVVYVCKGRQAGRQAY